MRCVYSCNNHPKVISGDITEDEAFLEFLANFSDSSNSGMISQCEWNDYYAAVSDAVEEDDHFIAMIKIAWKLWTWHGLNRPFLTEKCILVRLNLIYSNKITKIIFCNCSLYFDEQRLKWINEIW